MTSETNKQLRTAEGKPRKHQQLARTKRKEEFIDVARSGGKKRKGKLHSQKRTKVSMNLINELVEGTAQEERMCEKTKKKERGK